jgi:hypothetical protein
MLSPLFALVFLFGCGTGLPTPQGAQTSAVSSQPTGTSGLRGSPALLGYDPNNVLTTENTHDIKYDLAPGQNDDANLGTYLDFESISNPQPLRGKKVSELE